MSSVPKFETQLLSHTIILCYQSKQGIWLHTNLKERGKRKINRKGQTGTLGSVIQEAANSSLLMQIKKEKDISVILHCEN